jgi:hypothetical protein
MSQVFPEGISAFKPHEKAPEFVKADISVDAVKFQEWLQTHPEARDAKGYVRLTLKASREGKYYLAVNTYTHTDNGDEPQLTKEEIPF